jgi:hypothetical protein
VNRKLLAINGEPLAVGNIGEISDGPVFSLDDDFVAGNVNHSAAPNVDCPCRSSIFYLGLSLHLRVRNEGEGYANNPCAQQIAYDRS